MRPAYSIHNPFVNRFNDPVTRRQDDMQCDEYMAWLRERNRGQAVRQTTSARIASASARLGRMLAGLFGLLVLFISIAVFIKSL